jgi:hypothetical protein
MPADLEVIERHNKQHKEKPVESPEPSKALPRYLTRRDATKYVNEVLGIPLKESTIAKKAMRGTGPKPDSFYGKVELFTPQTIENWALNDLCANKPHKLNAA